MCRRGIGIGLVIALLLGNKATATQFAYQVTFTDKNNTPYSLSTPSAYLSSRAIARRATQGIAVDSTDLPVNASYIDSVLTLTGGIFHESSRWFNLCVVLVSDSTAIHALDGKPFISNVKLVAYYPTYLHMKPSHGGGGTVGAAAGANKTTVSDTYYYGSAWGQTALVDGNSLYDMGYQGDGELIALLDAGFSGTDIHPGFDSLWAHNRVLDTHNFTLASGNVFNYDDHGTSVLSTMGGYVPGTFVGAAPHATYALYITEDNNSEQPIELINMLCGTERADSLGADVITTSLGYNTFDDPVYNFVFATDFDGKTTTAARAANMATKKGILFVATAGNEGGDPWNMILTPGDADSALTIGSVNLSGTNAPNSGYGPNAAGQVKPDVCALGEPAFVFYDSLLSDIWWGDGSGTSFSTPQVAGWAACLWQANPSATPYQIRQAIIRCASSYATPGPHIGYGIPNFGCTEIILDVKPVSPVAPVANWIMATPNPFNGEVNLAVTPAQDGYVNFAILDMTGRQLNAWSQYVHKSANSSFSISTTNLPAGMYILRANTGAQQQIIKLQKN